MSTLEIHGLPQLGPHAPLLGIRYWSIAHLRDRFVAD